MIPTRLACPLCALALAVHVSPLVPAQESQPGSQALQEVGTPGEAPTQGGTHKPEPDRDGQVDRRVCAVGRAHRQQGPGRTEIGRDQQGRPAPHPVPACPQK